MHELKHRDRSTIASTIKDGKGKSILSRMKQWFDEL
jgi:hypothetical protein